MNLSAIFISSKMSVLLALFIVGGTESPGISLITFLVFLVSPLKFYKQKKQ